MRPTACALFWLAALLSATHADDRIPAGDTTPCNLQKLVTEGMKSFDPEQVRQALRECRVLSDAADPGPDFSLTRYAVILRRSVAAGYAHAGFAEATVRVRLDEGAKRFVVRIAEGNRYCCGDVRVTGLESKEAQELAQALTEPFAPLTAAEASFTNSDGGISKVWLEASGERARMGEPVWTRGTPAACDAIALDSIRERVHDLLAASGREFAEFDVRVEPHNGDDQVDLVVDFLDPGLEAVVNKIVVDGLQRNSRDAVLAFLGIEPEMPGHARLAPRLQRQLLESGRFLAAHVTQGVSFREEDRAASRLTISITEHPLLPLLHERLTPEEETLLRLGHWLTAWSEGQVPDDMVIESTVKGAAFPRLEAFAEVGLKGIVAPGAASTVTLKARTRAGREFTQTLLAAGQRFALSSPVSRNRCELPEEKGPPKWTATIMVRPGGARDTASGDVQNAFGFSAGLSATSLEDHRPQLQLVVEPSLLLLRSRQKRFESRGEAGRIHCRAEGLEAVVEETTGRLEKLRLTDADLGIDAVIHFERAALRRQLAEYDHRLAGTPNAFDADRPWQSALVYALDEYRRFAEPGLATGDLESLAALRKLLTHWTPAPGRHSASSPTAGEHALLVFSVPARETGSRQEIVNSEGTSSRRASARIEQYKLDTESDTAARPKDKSKGKEESFEETMARYRAMGNDEVDQAVRMVRSAPTGPMALLAAACILNHCRRDSAILLAEQGLERLSLDAYRRDYMYLLGNHELKPHIDSLGGAVRALTAPEISALARWLPSEWGQNSLRSCLLQLATEPERTVVEVLPPILDELWETALKERFAESLRSLAGDTRGKPRR
jgi:hypothetical protein